MTRLDHAIRLIHDQKLDPLDIRSEIDVLYVATLTAHFMIAGCPGPTS
jgi:hypothetical protein